MEFEGNANFSGGVDHDGVFVWRLACAVDE